jgi:hypothetical protein
LHDILSSAHLLISRNRSACPRSGWSSQSDPTGESPVTTAKPTARYGQIEEWQTAIEALILVAESGGGPTMLARIRSGYHETPEVVFLVVV